MNRSRYSVRSLILLMAVVFAVSMVSAQTAGYDLLQTSSGASIDLSSLGLGQVNLKGVPIQSSTGNTDTIMHRTADMPSGGGSVPANVTALFMESINPVTFRTQSCDVYVTINNSNGVISTSTLPQPDALSGSTGTVTIRTDGTFDSNITVNADVIFVKAGTSVSNSANYVGHQPASAVKVSSTNSSWSSTPPSGYPSDPNFPSGGFYPKPAHTGGPHPVVPAACPSSSPAPGGASKTGAALVRACAVAVQAQ